MYKRAERTHGPSIYKISELCDVRCDTFKAETNLLKVPFSLISFVRI